MEMEGTRYCGATVDVANFFDQISRPLVTQLARMGGMPEAIIQTYWRFHQSLKVTIPTNKGPTPESQNRLFC